MTLNGKLMIGIKDILISKYRHKEIHTKRIKILMLGIKKNRSTWNGSFKAKGITAEPWQRAWPRPRAC